MQHSNQKTTCNYRAYQQYIDKKGRTSEFYMLYHYCSKAEPKNDQCFAADPKTTFLQKKGIMPIFSILRNIEKDQKKDLQAQAQQHFAQQWRESAIKVNLDMNDTLAHVEQKKMYYEATEILTETKNYIHEKDKLQKFFKTTLWKSWAGKISSTQSLSGSKITDAQKHEKEHKEKGQDSEEQHNQAIYAHGLSRAQEIDQSEKIKTCLKSEEGKSQVEKLWSPGDGVREDEKYNIIHNSSKTKRDCVQYSNNNNYTFVNNTEKKTVMYVFELEKERYYVCEYVRISLAQENKTPSSFLVYLHDNNSRNKDWSKTIIGNSENQLTPIYFVEIRQAWRIIQTGRLLLGEGKPETGTTAARKIITRSQTQRKKLSIEELWQKLLLSENEEEFKENKKCIIEKYPKETSYFDILKIFSRSPHLKFKINFFKKYDQYKETSPPSISTFVRNYHNKTTDEKNKLDFRKQEWNKNKFIFFIQRILKLNGTVFPDQYKAIVQDDVRPGFKTWTKFKELLVELYDESIKHKESIDQKEKSKKQLKILNQIKELKYSYIKQEELDKIITQKKEETVETIAIYVLDATKLKKKERPKVQTLSKYINSIYTSEEEGKIRYFINFNFKKGPSKETETKTYKLNAILPSPYLSDQQVYLDSEDDIFGFDTDLQDGKDFLKYLHELSPGNKFEFEEIDIDYGNLSDDDGQILLAFFNDGEYAKEYLERK